MPHSTLRRPAALAALAFALIVSLGGLAPSPALAQDDAPKPTPSKTDKADNAVGFKAADGTVPKENLPAWPFLYGAYTFLWLLPLAYVVTLWRKQRQLDARIDALDQRLNKLDDALGG